MDSARSKHSKSSKKSSVHQSRGRQSLKSSRSSIRQAAIEERARIAELKLEAEFMVKQEETIQKQRMLEKELQIAKAEARLQIYEEEEERCSQASKSSISSVSSSKKDEMVRHYVKELPDEVESKNEKKQNIIVALPEDVPADTQGATVSKLIDSLQLPDIKIEVFDGNPLDFWFFMASFKESVESKCSDQRNKFLRLSQYLSGEPKELVEGCIFESSCYDKAKQMLTNQYGNRYRIINEYKKELKSWSKIKPNDSTCLRKFYTFLMKFKSVITESHDNQELIQLLHSKLPTYIQDRWNRTALKIRKGDTKEPSLVDFLELLQQEILLATDPLFSRQANDLTSTKDGPKLLNRKATYRTDAKMVCPLCADLHDLDECVTFLQTPVDERKHILFKKRLCFACYRPISTDHRATNCSNKRKCKICLKEHPTGLHGMSKSSKVEKTSEFKSARTTITSNISLCVVPVKIYSKDKYVDTYALLDNGSQASFVKTSIAEALDLPSTPTTVKIKTMTGEETSRCCMISNLLITNANNGKSVKIPTSYTKDTIPVDKDEIPTPEKIHSWKHLSHLQPFLPQVDTNIEVGVLIGGNCPAALEPIRVIPSKIDSPYAFETRLGWCIVGPITGRSSKQSVNRIAVKVDGKVASHCFCIPDKVIDQSINEKLMSMYRQDFNEKNDSSTTTVSQEDRKFLKLMKDKVTKMENHYQLPLPFRNEVNLPNNRGQAVQRAEWLKKKLSLNPKMHQHYKEFMGNLVKNGYALKLESEKLKAAPGKLWYVPHFEVYHPKKPDKIRIVLDSSATYKGRSLNNELMQGPDLTNNLLGVLLRFRLHEVAIMADVEAMFYQVLVPENHQNFLRFLWWPDGNLNSKLQDYVMTRHIQGATSSPSVANYALKQAASDNENEYGKEAADTLRNSFYVDDMLKSYEGTQTAIDQFQRTVQMCNEGGFHLTKVVSNSRQVMKSVSREEHGKSFKELDLSCDVLPVERALGVHWCIENDTFGFRIVLKDQPLTRRGILSTVSSIYDPLGLAAPFVLQGKLILQQLCIDKKGWDEPLNEKQIAAWTQWRRDLPKLESIKVDRCIKPKDFGHIVNYSIHHFSDASSIAYGQASYLRVENSKGDVSSTLLVGKSRVAPIKPVTIPRLELTAATVSAKVAALLRTEISIEPCPEFFWTDSEVVLGYLKNERKRFYLFVANRVQTILSISRSDQWKHVKSDQNPADDASRPINIREFSTQHRWFRGPEMLKKPLPELEMTTSPITINEDDPEIKVNLISTTSQDQDLLSRITNRTSSWVKAKRIVCTMLMWKTKKKTIEIEDLVKAETILIRLAQQQEFQQEINHLRDNKNVSKSSSISSLNPFIDSEEILRVGGRLSRSNLEFATVHPVILPKRSHVTKMIILECHESVQHAGRGFTINEIRTRGFWIVNCNSSVRHMIYNCVKCRRLRGSTSYQQMANLPSDRLEVSPPFTICGVDYFGPFIIKDGRKELKRYGVLFTCFASRAVHIETSNTLETDSFIQALRRLISRRGNIRTIYSDNGTNLVGAQRELSIAIKELDHERIKTFLQMHGGDWMIWKRNPPAASHFGGVWERQIRTVRSILNSLMMTHGHSLNDESFRTFMVEVEGIINSRPLTTETLSDVDSFLPLAPANLLTMKSNVIAPPPGVFDQSEIYSRKRWRRVQHLLNEFWTRWRKEYVHTLQTRNKWRFQKRSLKVGDVVILKDPSEVRNHWPLYIVEQVFPDKEGIVRTVTVRNSSGQQFKRPIAKLIVLLETES